MLEVTDSRVACLAGEIVRDAVAPAAAAGFVRMAAEWEVSVGGETNTIFDLASLTKPMTALAVARSGLDRGAPIAAILAEADGCEATVEMLLAHRGGLEAHVPLYAPLATGGSVDRAAALRAAALARRADVASLPAAPLYSDLGYALVGEALARHVGARDAGEAIEELVVAPLGLADDLGTARALEARNVGFAERVAPTEDVAWRGGVVRGRVHDENAWALTGDGGSGHAGMFGTIRGVLVFAAAAHDAIMLAHGPLAGSDLAWLVAPRPGGDLRAGFDGKSDRGSSAGERAGPRTFGHLGFTGTSVWIDPDARAAVALLTNRVHPTRENTAIRVARPRVHDALWSLATR
ncbi:MAG TPA: serine hydrolase domain-containing protein [Labilithrix sp.]